MVRGSVTRGTTFQKRMGEDFARPRRDYPMGSFYLFFESKEWVSAMRV